MGNVGVNAWILRSSAAHTPRDDSHEFAIDNKGATRVTLARVFASLRNSSANFPLRNSSDLSVRFVARRSRDYRNRNLAETQRKLTGFGGTPTGDQSVFVNKSIGASLIQRYRFPGVVELERVRVYHTKQGDIVRWDTVTIAAIVFMSDHLLNSVHRTTGIDVGRAGTYEVAAGWKIGAMSSGYHPVLGDYATSAEVATIVLQAHLVRRCLDGRFLATNDATVHSLDEVVHRLVCYRVR